MRPGAVGRWWNTEGVLLETVGFDRELSGRDGRSVDRQAMHIGWISGIPWATALLQHARRTGDEREDLRTLHATLVCVAAALLVFGMQALSSLPVLRAIGLTVALGVGFHFCLSILMARAKR